MCVWGVGEMGWKVKRGEEKEERRGGREGGREGEEGEVRPEHLVLTLLFSTEGTQKNSCTCTNIVQHFMHDHKVGA